MAQYKLNIFDALAAVDRRDGAWLDRQPPETRDGLAPPVFLRWASVLGDDSRAAQVLLALNAVVNPHLYDIHRDHPDLLFKLTALCGAGSRQRHTWIAGPKRRASSNLAHQLLARFHPDANDQEIDLLLRLHTPASFAAFVEATAVEAPKDIIKSYDQYRPTSRSG